MLQRKETNHLPKDESKIEDNQTKTSTEETKRRNDEQDVVEQVIKPEEKIEARRNLSEKRQKKK
ncbi:MAG: hypothetical protein ACLUD1_01300 [Clostridia bacterium]